MPRFVAYDSLVVCDESGHTKFPFSYIAHVTLLNPGSGIAQSLLRICSGWLNFAHPNYNFRQAKFTLTLVKGA